MTIYKMSVSFFVSVLPWASVKSILRDPGCIVDFLQKKLKSEQMFPHYFLWANVSMILQMFNYQSEIQWYQSESESEIDI